MSEKEKNRRYALYIRVSTEEQARSKEGSIVSQGQRIQEYIRWKGYEDNAIQIMYKEEGKSGKDTNRPEYQRLQRDIQQGKVDTVICTEISRISRCTMDFLKFIELCKKHDVCFISLRELFDTSTALGEAVMTICVALAQLERKQVSERTSANVRARARRGLWNGGYIYGYHPVPNQKGYLYIDEHEAQIINFMFDQYLESGSYCIVANWLTEQGYRTREYTSRVGKFHPAGKFCKSTVIQMLQNLAYIGKLNAEGEIVDAVWESIVTQEKWEKAQSLLKKNRKISGNSKRSNKHHTYLLSSLVHCQYCGIMLENGNATGRSDTYFYYRHPGKKQTEDCPHPSNIPAKELEKMVCERVLQIMEDAALLDTITDEVMQKVNEDIKSVRERLASLDKEITDLNKKGGGLTEQLEKYTEAYILEFLTPKLKDIWDRKKMLEKSKEELVRELQDLQEQSVSPEDIRFAISSLMNEFNEMKPRQQQRVMEMLVEKVELHPKEIHVFLHAFKNLPKTEKPLKELSDGSFSGSTGCPARTRT